MKKIYFLMLVLLMSGFAHAQYTIDFDSFTTGDVSVQSSHIILWPAPEATDAQVTDVQANSAPHSMLVRPSSGSIADDVLFQLGDKDSGTWVVEWMLYVPSGATGYWNLQEHETGDPGQWNGEFFIGNTNSGGSAGMITHDQTSATVAYPSDTWFPVKVTVDLDALEISVLVDGNPLLQGAAYSGVVSGSNVAASQLGGVDFFSVDGNTTFYIDDFNFHEICYPPTNLVVNALTDTTADLSWTASPNETGGGNWTLMLEGENPDTDTPVQTGTAPTGTTSVALSGLSPYTEYDFYLMADCGNNGVSSRISINFQTELSCQVSGAVASFPYTTGFELSDPNLGCWEQIKEDGDGDWIFAEGASSGTVVNAYAGTSNARFVSTIGENSPITKLVSPVLDLSGLSNPELSFYYAQEKYVSDQNELKVYYRESESDVWVELAHYTSEASTWTEERLALPNPTATYQIAFEGINNFGHANVLDEVRVGELLAVEAFAASALKIYPNPAKNTVFLDSKQMIDQVVVHNLLGEQVLSTTMNTFDAKLNVSSLPSGMYLVEVFIGGSSKTYKLLKE